MVEKKAGGIKAQATKKASSEKPKGGKKGKKNPKAAAAEPPSIAFVASYFPSVNLTPPSMIPLPYNLIALLQAFQNISPDVQVNGSKAIHIDSYAPTCKGDAIGSGGGIQTGTVGNVCQTLDYCPSVRVSGKKNITYHGAWAWMNCPHPGTKGNTKGKFNMLFVQNMNPPDPDETHLVFDRVTETLVLHKSDGTTEVFKAHNRTTHEKLKQNFDVPDSQSLTPNSNRPLPDGTFPLGDHEPLAKGDKEIAIGKAGKIPVVLPPGPEGWRGVSAPGRVLIHSFESPRTVDSRTFGCIRTTKEAIQAIEKSKPSYIIVQSTGATPAV